MERLNPDKLSVEFNYATDTEPIVGRYYTLTHSDTTGELYLTIGVDYAYDEINPVTKDAVLASWNVLNNRYFIAAFCYVSDESMTKEMAEIRYNIYVKELPLALEAIRYGDRIFFETYPDLNYAPIWIYFYSQYPEFDKIEFWGTPKDYE